MIYRIVYIFIIILFSISCGGKENKKDINILSLKDSSLQIVNTKKNNPEITEKGLVKQVEDSGYPFATVTIEFPERKFTENFILNMEEVENASLNVINTYVGKYVKFTYTTEISFALLDVFQNSRSVFGSELAPEGEGIKSIEGILYGAERVTSGDIPGEVSIMADDGENLYFEYFITQDLVSVNEKRVTGFYDERTKNTIKSIELIED